MTGPQEGAARPPNPLLRRWHRFVELWRRSLQLRIVTTTLVLGLVTVSVISGYMYRSIADGLVADRVALAEAQSRQLALQAQANFDETDRTSNAAELSDVVSSTVRQHLAPPADDASRYVIFTRSLDNDSSVRLETVLSGTDVRLDQVPAELRQAVAADPERQQTTTIDLVRRPTPADPTNPADEPAPVESIPAVVVGSQVQVPLAGAYDLYFVYPMEQEQQTLGVIVRSFGLGSLFLIILVSAVAYVVTRLVVTPVRRAAAAAERLSSGHLNERMSARGTDDLALLGQSFNEMADNIQTQIRQLEGLSRVQQRFVSDVSHELRTPLTTVRMAADLIYSSREDMDPVVARSAELLYTELDRFEALLADLLEISRYDAGAAVLEVEPVDVIAVAERAIESAAHVAERRGSEVQLVRGSATAVADIDSRRIERILRNLVVNAVEHGEGRPVEVFVDENDSCVSVVVQDHGVGLRQGEASMVFNRFWRADPARTRTTGGTGLGLAISLEDARLHHGWLQAWGEPGAGSRFRLTIPKEDGGVIREPALPLTPREVERQEAGP